MGVFSRIFGSKSNNSPTDESESKSFYQTLYPESVRYALAYRGAKMGNEEIIALIPGFTYEALYLMIKALAETHEAEAQFLNDLTRLILKPDYSTETLQAFLKEEAAKLPADTLVNGAKLAQLSRSGSNRWQEAFKTLAEGVLDENENALPCLVAYTTLLGYEQFVRTFNEHNKTKISIVVPEWMTDPDEPMMGYEVTLGDEPSVKLQPKDKCLIGTWNCMKQECKLRDKFCGNAVFVDDTINTGTTSRKLTSFWHTEYGLNIPVDRVRVITDLRGQGFKNNKVDGNG